MNTLHAPRLCSGLARLGGGLAIVVASASSLGCGSEAPPAEGSAAAAPGATAAPAGNAPPRIERLLLRPDNPTRSDVVQLDVSVVDPERDAIQLDVEWYRNGSLVKRGPDLQLPGQELGEGDEVMARVTASDGTSSVRGESTRVRVGNSPPNLARIELLPEEPSGADTLVVTAQALDPDGDEVAYRYEWWKNDERVAGVDGATLDASNLARGDEVWVSVTPSDGTSEGEPLRSVARLVRNAAPRITSEPSYDVAGPNLYEYSIEAEDADGDRPLRFELIQGPPGMEIDLVTGHLSWVVPPSASGDFDVEVAVRDPLGGESRQRYALKLGWEAPASQAP